MRKIVNQEAGMEIRDEWEQRSPKTEKKVPEKQVSDRQGAI